jgi:hypothetical protein
MDFDKATRFMMTPFAVAGAPKKKNRVAVNAR